jgi:hypothetical protein
MQHFFSSIEREFHFLGSHVFVPAFDLRGHAFGGTKTRPKCGHPKARQQRANLLVSQQ